VIFLSAGLARHPEVRPKAGAEGPTRSDFRLFCHSEASAAPPKNPDSSTFLELSPRDDMIEAGFETGCYQRNLELIA
jgi:hypothetical protein